MCFCFYCLRLRDSFLFGTWHKSTDKDNGGISFGGCGNLSAGLARNLWFMDFVKLQVILAILCEQPFVYRLSTHCRLCIRASKEMGRMPSMCLCFLRLFALKLLSDVPYIVYLFTCLILLFATIKAYQCANFYRLAAGQP